MRIQHLSLFFISKRSQAFLGGWAYIQGLHLRFLRSGSPPMGLGHFKQVRCKSDVTFQRKREVAAEKRNPTAI